MKPLTPATIRQARLRLLQMHYESRVGHIGGNLSALDAMLLVFHEALGPTDEFVLSKGHAAGALYIALWSTGALQDADLATFHGEATRLPGHPPRSGLPRTAFATGSLGHGLSLASGLALGQQLRRNAGRVICMTSDGEWQEGSTWEALIFACHHRLANLTVLVDQNQLQGFGSVSEVASMAPLERRLAGFDIQLSHIDGHDPQALRDALALPNDRHPHIVVLKTTKGKGVSFMENRLEWHYLPMTQDQYQSASAEVQAA